jgi:hypothetical protein
VRLSLVQHAAKMHLDMQELQVALPTRSRPPKVTQMAAMVIGDAKSVSGRPAPWSMLNAFHMRLPEDIGRSRYMMAYTSVTFPCRL